MQKANHRQTRLGRMHAMHRDTVYDTGVGLAVIHADDRHRVATPDELAGENTLLHLRAPDRCNAPVAGKNRPNGRGDETDMRPVHPLALLPVAGGFAVSAISAADR